MNEPNEIRIRGFLIGTSESLASETLEALVQLCTSTKEARRGGVIGPQGITRQTVPEIGKVVVKHYLRGGILRFFNNRSYLALGDYRSKHEYLMLQRVRSLGVSAPRPVAYGIEGKIFYRAWLILAELEGVVALADLAAPQAQDRFEHAMEQLVAQVQRLVENRIFHIDLHPGNVVVDEVGQLYILDFDKAQIFCGSLNELRDCYVRRWRRAVIKHGLPEVFSEIFCAHLRRKFNDGAA